MSQPGKLTPPRPPAQLQPPTSPTRPCIHPPTRCRSSGDDLASRRLLTELLIQMTAATNRPGCLLFVLAATNRLQDCDPALLRRWVGGRAGGWVGGWAGEWDVRGGLAAGVPPVDA